MSSSIKNLYQFRTTSKITQSQGATSTFTVGTDIFTNSTVAITGGNIKLTNRTGSKVELFTVTVAAGTSTIAARGIKPDGTTSTTYQYERPKNTLCTLVVLESQIFDKGGSETLTGNLTYSGDVVYSKSAKFPVYADATARDAGISSPANGMMIYNTALGLNQQYIGGSWVNVDTGTATGNATEGAVGLGELGTTAEVTAGTATGGAGPLILTPDKAAAQIQSGSWVYCASTTGSDTYTANLTPSLTAYTTGMLLPCTFTTTNTGACSININGLGAKNIKTKDGNDPQTGVIRANGTALLMYDGTNFVIQSEDFATATVKGINNIYNIGGLGGNGNLTISSGTTTISGAGGIAYAEYDNVTISGTATLTSNQRLTHIKVKGNFTMSAGTIQVNGLGSSGGSGTSDNGDNIYNQYALTTIGGGTSGESTGLGGGATQSTVGKDFMIIHSGGGGGTSQDYNGGAIAGGAGGGILIIEVGGAINFTGGTISANGNVGGSVGGYASASGGGGGGGSIVILYRTLTAISGTIQATGGAGGVSGGSSTAYNFGGGGGGGYGAGGNYNSAGSAGLALGATATVTGGNAGSGGTQADSRGGGGGGGFVYVTQY